MSCHLQLVHERPAMYRECECGMEFYGTGQYCQACAKTANELEERYSSRREAELADQARSYEEWRRNTELEWERLARRRRLRDALVVAGSLVFVIVGGSYLAGTYAAAFVGWLEQMGWVR